MSRGLLDLPDELIAQVCQLLKVPHSGKFWSQEDDAQLAQEGFFNPRLPPLCAVMLVNRRLHSIARQTLLEDLDLCSGSVAARFPQSCKAHPAILQYLRKLRVHWLSFSSDRWASDLFDTVSVALNLIELRIETLEDGSEPAKRLQGLEVLVDRLRSLEIFIANIDQICVPHYVFLKICGMPRMRVFGTNRPLCNYGSDYAVTAPVDEFYQDVQQDNTSATRLEKLCCTGEYVDLAVIRHVLLRSPQLKTLNLSLSGPDANGRRWKSDHEEAHELGRLDFRPDLLNRLLDPCSSTLHELSVRNENVSLKHSLSYGNIFNLRSFHQLRRLVLSNCIIRDIVQQRCNKIPGFQTEVSDTAWYEILPESLEHLEIHFDCCVGLLWNIADLKLLEYDHYAEWTSRDDELIKEALGCWNSNFEVKYFKPILITEANDTASQRLNWIMSLATIASNKFQYLTTIKVTEKDSTLSPRMCRRWDLVDLVQTYPEVFDRQEVDLELNVRVPPEFIPPNLETIRNQPVQGGFADGISSIPQAYLEQALRDKARMQMQTSRSSPD